MRLISVTVSLSWYSMEWYPLRLDAVTDCIFIGQTQPEINFDALHEIDNSNEEELSLMLLGTVFPR